jgi:hypothetical protein
LAMELAYQLIGNARLLDGIVLANLPSDKGFVLVV